MMALAVQWLRNLLVLPVLGAIIALVIVARIVGGYVPIVELLDNMLTGMPT